MKKLLLVISIYLYYGVNSSIAQEFSDMKVNPFSINIDTSGGVEVYSFNFADIDEDGDLDIIYPYINDSIALAFQENVGDAKNPEFGPIETLDFHFVPEIGFFIPDFEDVNNDGFVDMIAFGAVDESEGFAFSYFKNNGDRSFTTVGNEELGLPGVGYAFGIPEITDINQDGDFDLIVSGAQLETFTEENDAFFYFGQNSSVSEPMFNGWFVEPYSFAFVDTFQSIIIRAGDLDLDGDQDLLAAVTLPSEENVYMYQENRAGFGERADFSGTSVFEGFGLPERSAGMFHLEDIDGDGDLDLFELDDLDIIYYENISCIPSRFELPIELCEGGEVTINDEVFSKEGVYTQVFENETGCDSTLVISVEILETLSTSFEASVCMGSDYSWEGENFSDAGTYERVFMSSLGCDSIVVLNLIQEELEFSLDLFGDSLLLQVANGQDLQIEWYNCLTGATVANNDLAYLPNESGSYGVIIRSGECEYLSQCETINLTSSYTEISEKTVSVFPNPTSDQIFIEVSFSHELNGKTIRLTNVFGQRFNMTCIDGLIDVSALSEGIYYMGLEEFGISQKVSFIKIK